MVWGMFQGYIWVFLEDFIYPNQKSDEQMHISTEEAGGRFFSGKGPRLSQEFMVGEDRIEIHSTLATLKIARGSDQGSDQGWCMLKILNEERAKEPPESSKMTGYALEN